MKVRLGFVLALLSCLPCCRFDLRHQADKEAQAVAGACRWLASQQAQDGSIAFRSRLLYFNVWDTANALIALLRCGAAVDSATIDRGFEFLDANWTQEGGLPESSRRRLSHQGYCVETTSTGLRAYAAAGKRSRAEKLRDFLYSVQEPDGGWKIGFHEVRNYPNGAVLEVYPSVTGFALAAAAAAAAAAEHGPSVDRGLAWLAARQNSSGDWGAFSDYFDTPYYATAQILSAFVGWGRPDDPAVQGAIRFTRKHQSPDGSWGDSGDSLAPSRELRTALALLTLQAVHSRSEKEAIGRGLRYLLERQRPDGSWFGGFFKSEFVPDHEKKEDIYATSLAIVALTQNQESGKRSN